MKKILFVDDKPAIGKVLSVYLGKENELVYFEDPGRYAFQRREYHRTHQPA